MAKKQKNGNAGSVTINITPLNFDSGIYLNDSSLDYAISTLDRAIPGIDGLKASQRKAIFTMSKISGEIKTISAAGRMISDGIYLHGDGPAADTLANLVSPVTRNIPLLGGRGGFGTPVNQEPASPRYTYVKRSRATEALVLPDLDIVPMIDNYDGSTQEPKFFLPLIPLVLLGVNGISTAYRCRVLPRKIEDIIDNCIRALDKKKLKEMTPDFSCTGSHSRVDDLGENKFMSYGIVDILDTSTVRVLGLPTDLKLEPFVERLIRMQEEGTIRDYDDASSATVDITIKLPRGTANGWTEDNAFEYFGLQSKLTEFLNLQSVNNKIKQYESVDAIIEHYVVHRLGFYTKRYQHLLNLAEKKLAYQLLQEACFRDDMISKVKTFESRNELQEFVQRLNAEIQASPEDVNNIVQFATYRWTKEGEKKLQADIADNVEKINTYLDLLDNPDKIQAIYREELVELKKLKF